LLASGGIRTLNAVLDEQLVHLLLMPVAGVGEHDAGNLHDSDRVQLGEGGADGWPEQSEVR